MPKLVFLSECCVLDRKSGAAQTVRAVLHALAGAGWECHAATMTLCDGEQDISLSQHCDKLDPKQHAGTVAKFTDGLVNQHVHVNHSTRHVATRPWELRGFLRMAAALLEEVQPDIVLTYSSEAMHPLLAQAQQQGARTVFYVAVPAYAQREGFNFRFVDEFLAPSQALADLYLELKGIECKVLGDLVQAPFDGSINLAPERIAARGERYVTMVNPEPAKGGLFFINVAVQTKAQAPQVKFRAVESRWGRAVWHSKGLQDATLNTIDWHPHTQDMAAVFEQSALLLVPSLWFEASARVVAEALLAGVPVLAMKSGGVEAQLNGGGFLFDPPPQMAANYLAPPELADLRPWVQYIQVLMEDDALYTQAVKLALQAAEKHRPEAAAAAAVATFEALAAGPALESLRNSKEVHHQLEALRNRINTARQEVNLQFEQPSVVTNQSAEEPYADVLRLSLKQPAIREAMAALKAADYEHARVILEQYLRILPEDLVALGMLAGVADKQQREAEACRLMTRVVSLAPGFEQGQRQLLDYLSHAGNPEAALVHSFELLERVPNQLRYLALHAALLTMNNRFEEAINVYGAFFKRSEGRANDWMHYALALKTLGQQQAAVDAYRKAIKQAPGFGAAWHALSNTKLAVFTPSDVEVMKGQLANADLSEEDQYNLHFTLGKAFEDDKAYEPSFEHYAQANRIRRSQSDYDIAALEGFVDAAKRVFTREFFNARKGQGDPTADPIFIVGLHRSGTTLTEQILASHSQIEGTRELPDLLRICRDFAAPEGGVQRQPLRAELVEQLGADEWARLGQEYLHTTQSDRKTDRPGFIDKMPVNWMYAGFIHLMLPKARIIDVRRKPMAAGFALFKMNFGKGVQHAYSQSDIARYYLAYTDLMAHFDEVLPGRIHHLQYEDLVANTDDEIRRLLDYCGVPFEPGCLRYWETDRAVQTPSSEQVRQPIYQHAAEHWRNYEPWLGEMKAVFAGR